MALNLQSFGRSRTWVLTTLIALSASACGDASSTAAPAIETESSADATELLIGDFGTIDGPTLDLARVQGKDVVLWFWAPW